MAAFDDTFVVESLEANDKSKPDELSPMFEEESEIPPRTRRGNQKKSKRKPEVQDCPIESCEDTKVSGSRYCMLHTSTMKWLQKHYTNPKTRDTEEASEYRSIFGSKKDGAPDPELADTVVEDLTEADVASNRKPGQPRDKTNLSIYVRSRGSRDSQEDESAKYKWEEDIFATKMPLCRPWTEDQSRKYFRDVLKPDPTIKRDNGGFKGAERLYIPPELIGEDKEVDKRGNFHERRVDTASKATAITSATEATWLADTRKGFNFNDVKLQGDTQDMRKSLPASSIGQSVISTVEDIIRKHAETQGSASSADDLPCPAVVKTEPEEPIKQPKAMSPAGVADAKNKLWATMRDQLKEVKNKLTTEAKAATLLLASADQSSEEQKTN